MQDHEYFMQKAIEIAKSSNDNEVPVGAVLVKSGEIVSTASNKREENSSILAHAEILAMENYAKKTKSWNLSDCKLYITLEPCAMCAGAILQAHIQEVIFAAYDNKSGAFGSRYNLVNNNLKITGGILEEEAASVLREFFSQRR